MVDKDLDCFGWLYNPSLIPCKQNCAARFLCKDQLKQNMLNSSEDEFKERQRRIIMNNEVQTESTVNTENNEAEVTLEPTFSETVSKVIETLESLGLKPVTKKGYIAFKIEGRNILAINKMKANSVKDLVKFVFHKSPDSFPEETKQYISDKKAGEYHFVKAEDISELKTALTVYLASFKS